MTNVASGLYWDAMAVRQCDDAGEGAQMRLGGKTEPPRANRSTSRVASCGLSEGWATTSGQVLSLWAHWSG